ncbi:MAG: prepilin-type N-terminal cleavage/methylation domain-containing protein [Phycisphaerales bacterium]
MRTGPSARQGARRGMTMLEVVLAVVLLALLAATFATSHSYIHAAASREAQRLGAAEIANRMMLQYIDDKKMLPPQSTQLDYNQQRYRWSLDEIPVDLKLDPAAAENESQRGGGLGLERIRMIVVRAWLSEDSGGSYIYTDSVPSITLTRLFDPLGFEHHSPDSAERQLGTEEGIREVLDTILRLQGGTQSGDTSGKSGSGGSSTGGTKP